MNQAACENAGNTISREAEYIAIAIGHEQVARSIHREKFGPCNPEATTVANPPGGT